MAENIHEKIKRDRAAALINADKIRDYRNYAAGEQRGTISAEQKKILGAVVAHDFADNVSDLILATAAARLELTGYQVESESVQVFLDALFVKNQLGDLSADAHYRTLRDGNHAIGLRWKAEANDDLPVDAPEPDVPQTRGLGRVTLHHEDWWDGKTGVFVAYDEGGAPAYAVKDFTQWIGDRSRNRRTVYFPDHLERYIQEGTGWKPFPLPGEPATGIVPWTKRDGSPLGIPIVHFSNGRFGASPYGVSDLAGGLLGLQDELNDIQRDITAAARLTAFQMIAATGVDLKTTPLTVGPGRVLNAVAADARFVAIPPGDMSQLIAAHDKKLSTMARNSATPLHLITGGDWPSGAALLRAEMPLIAKVQRLAKTIGPAWQTVGHRATELANAFGGSNLDEDALITVRFAPPEKLDELTLAQIAKAQADAQLAVEMLQDPESLIALGIPAEEANARIRRREQRQAARDEMLTGVGGEGQEA